MDTVHLPWTFEISITRRKRRFGRGSPWSYIYINFSFSFPSVSWRLSNLAKKPSFVGSEVCASVRGREISKYAIFIYFCNNWETKWNAYTYGKVFLSTEMSEIKQKQYNISKTTQSCSVSFFSEIVFFFIKRISLSFFGCFFLLCAVDMRRTVKTHSQNWAVALNLLLQNTHPCQCLVAVWYGTKKKTKNDNLLSFFESEGGSLLSGSQALGWDGKRKATPPAVPRLEARMLGSCAVKRLQATVKCLARFHIPSSDDSVIPFAPYTCR